MILEAQDVRHFYGAFCALDGVTLGIEPGQFVSMIGPNGAGKSTLINVLTGSSARAAAPCASAERTSRGPGRCGSRGSGWRGASSWSRSSPS